MKPNQFIRIIRRYSLFSFLLPLIAINLCLFMYTLLGKIDTFPNGNDYSKKIIQHTPEKYIQINDDMENRAFTNCPKTKVKTYLHTHDNQKLLLKSLNLFDFIKNNKAKYITILAHLVNSATDNCLSLDTSRKLNVSFMQVAELSSLLHTSISFEFIRLIISP